MFFGRIQKNVILFDRTLKLPILLHKIITQTPKAASQLLLNIVVYAVRKSLETTK